VVGPTWFELSPEMVVTAGSALFVIDRTDAVTTAFKGPSGRLMLVAAVEWIVGRVAIARHCPWLVVDLHHDE
jgi:hypothetical protein